MRVIGGIRLPGRRLVGAIAAIVVLSPAVATAGCGTADVFTLVVSPVRVHEHPSSSDSGDVVAWVDSSSRSVTLTFSDDVKRSDLEANVTWLSPSGQPVAVAVEPGASARDSKVRPAAGFSSLCGQGPIDEPWRCGSIVIDEDLKSSGGEDFDADSDGKPGPSTTVSVMSDQGLLTPNDVVVMTSEVEIALTDVEDFWDGDEHQTYNYGVSLRPSDQKPSLSSDAFLRHLQQFPVANHPWSPGTIEGHPFSGLFRAESIQQRAFGESDSYQVVTACLDAEVFAAVNIGVGIGTREIPDPSWTREEVERFEYSDTTNLGWEDGRGTLRLDVKLVETDSFGGTGGSCQKLMHRAREQ